MAMSRLCLHELEGNSSSDLDSSLDSLQSYGPDEKPSNWGKLPRVILKKILSLLPFQDRFVAFKVCRYWRDLCRTEWVSIFEGFSYSDKADCPRCNVLPGQFGTKIKNKSQESASFHQHLRGNDFPGNKIRNVRFNIHTSFPHQLCLTAFDLHDNKIKNVRLNIHTLRGIEILERLAHSNNYNSLKHVVIEWACGASRRGDYYLDHDAAVERRDLSRFTYILELFLSHSCEIEVLTLDGCNFDTQFYLDHFGQWYRTLRKLNLFNSLCNQSSQMFDGLVNLTELTIGLKQLGGGTRGTWLCKLAENSLRVLNLVQETEMRARDFISLPDIRLSDDIWKQITTSSPNMKVNCYFEGFNCTQNLFSSKMPLDTFVCDVHHYCSITKILTPYWCTLTTFIDFSLEPSVKERCVYYKTKVDEAMVDIARTCLNLTTVAVQPCLYSTTLLLMAQCNPNLTSFFVREDRIVYDLHISADLERSLPSEVVAFAIKNFSKDWAVAKAMSKVLHYGWAPLSAELYRANIEAIYNRPLGPLR